MAFTQAAASDVLKDIVKRGQLRVAVQTQGPPVSFIDKHDKRTGFAIEVVKMMAKDMGVELKLLDYEWKGLIPAVNSGKADFLAADMTPNAKRTLVLSFTEPYLYSDVVLYSKKSQPFKKWQDACKKGVAVGVVQGSSNVGLLKKI
ncbi:MAG: transporter substrate-binding domain-containing protein, partial [Alphaproteobacteria bacterium]|nr:transporter substrate-binding domain-containing protein [Alphaproteobacteria bacterium]